MASHYYAGEGVGLGGWGGALTGGAEGLGAGGGVETDLIIDGGEEAGG